tara:strand:+ start:63 stop:1055 length:993 start_codon:yes stop_codon:yes gene_type:complete
MKGQIMSLITSSGILPTLKTRIPRHDENHVREITVFQTKDFSIFKSVEGNRSLDEKNLRRIRKSMLGDGLLNPIEVAKIKGESGLFVANGQHRLENCKILCDEGVNFPVEYYINSKIFDSKYDFVNYVQKQNSFQKNWTPLDHLDSRCEVHADREDHIRLRSLKYMFPVEKENPSMSQALIICSYFENRKRIGTVNYKNETVRFTCSQSTIEKAKSFWNRLHKSHLHFSRCKITLAGNKSIYVHEYFIRAVLNLMRFGKNAEGHIFTLAELDRQFKKHGKHYKHMGNNDTDNLKEILKIYNYAKNKNNATMIDYDDYCATKRDAKDKIEI